MGKIIATFLVIFFGCCYTVNAQTSTGVDTSLLPPTKTISDSCANVEIDNMGNIYMVHTNGNIYKLNHKLDTLAVYNTFKQYGSLYSLCVTNPFKIIAYYKGFNTIVMLNKLLQPEEVIKLNALPIKACSAVTLSYDNNIWAFDEVNNKIVKLNTQGKILFETADVTMLSAVNFQCRYLIDFNKYLYAIGSHYQILKFDYVGNLVAVINTSSAYQNPTVFKNFIIGYNGKKNYKLNILNNTETLLHEPVCNKFFYTSKYKYWLINSKLQQQSILPAN